MKLVKFDINSNGGDRLGRSTITLSKNGIISFSKKFAIVMGIKNGDKISLSHDEHSPGDWYVHHDSQGFSVRKVKGGTLIIQCASLCDIVRENLQLNINETHKLQMATIATRDGDLTLYAIITASAGRDHN